MTDDFKPLDNETQSTTEITELTPEQLEASDPFADIDVSKIDFSRPETWPEALKNLKIQLPPKHVMLGQVSSFKKRLSGRFNYPKPKTNKFWYNGELVTEEAFDAISWEDRHTYLNKITKARK